MRKVLQWEFLSLMLRIIEFKDHTRHSFMNKNQYDVIYKQCISLIPLGQICRPAKSNLRPHVAEQRGFSAEIATDHYQDSESYWRHEQDIGCDMVRQMHHHCAMGDQSDDAMAQKIYDFCHKGLRPETESLAFPNYFITTAPAEWLFPKPVWLQESTVMYGS